MRREGPLQKAIVRVLQEQSHRNVLEIGRLIHLKSHPTKAEIKAIQRATRALMKKGMVEQEFFNAGDCYHVTAKASAPPSAPSRLKILKGGADR